MGLVEGRGAARGGAAPAHPALAQLLGYWGRLCAGSGLPTRSQIDPRGIDRALEFAFIAERLAPGVARFRLAGMHLNDLMGTDVRGLPLSCFFEPDSRPAVAVALERAFGGHLALDLALDSPRGLGRPALAGQLLLLPLRNEAGEVARLLGGLAAAGPPGRAPRRFRLAGVGEASAGPVRGHLRLVHSRA